MTFLSSVGWDLLWSTCIPNMKSLSPSVTKIGKMKQKVDKYQLSLTNPRDAMHHSMLQTKMDAQRDKLVTELSWQCLWWSTFLSYSELLSKIADFNLPNLYSAPPLGVMSFEFCQDLQHQKTRVPGLSCGAVCVMLCLTIAVEHRLVTDRQTDRYTWLRHIPC